MEHFGPDYVIIDAAKRGRMAAIPLEGEQVNRYLDEHNKVLVATVTDWNGDEVYIYQLKR